jgi:GntR family transcriptional regulator
VTERRESVSTTAVVPRLAIDRSSPVPLYYQVAQHLEDAIESGAIVPGTLFENEVLLGEQLGISRQTMRSAMQYLVDKGLVVRRRGVGTRVVQPKVRRPLELSSLYDDLAATGADPTTSVLDLCEVEAEEEVADRLQVVVGSVVTRSERLRSVDGRPIAKMVNYLPMPVDVFADGALERDGLYSLLRARGLQLRSAHQTVGARSATAAEATLLDERRGAALLTMQRVTYDDQGVVVEYGTHLYAASRYSVEISLLST